MAGGDPGPGGRYGGSGGVWHFKSEKRVDLTILSDLPLNPGCNCPRRGSSVNLGIGDLRRRSDAQEGLMPQPRGLAPDVTGRLRVSVSLSFLKHNPDP